MSTRATTRPRARALALSAALALAAGAAVPQEPPPGERPAAERVVTRWVSWLRVAAGGDPAAAANEAATRLAGVPGVREVEVEPGPRLRVHHTDPHRALRAAIAERAPLARLLAFESSGRERLGDGLRLLARATLAPPGTAPAWSSARAHRVATLDLRARALDAAAGPTGHAWALELPPGVREEAWSGIARELLAGQRVFELVLADDAPADPAVVAVFRPAGGGAPLRLEVPLVGAGP